MSMIDLQEQEQLDALKAWWKDNRKWLFTVLAIVLVAWAALAYWKNYQENKSCDQ